jgi:Family of unknown function (DUF6152)
VLKHLFIATALASVAAIPASAHHSGAMFDDAKEVTLVGTIKEFQYTNPHSWIQILVPREGGGDVEWSIETAAPIVLLRAGIRPQSLKPGDKVTLRTHPLKSGGPGGDLIDVKKEDGTVLSTRAR